MMRLRLLLIGALGVAAFGQEFSAVSIKPNHSNSGDSDSNTDQGMLNAHNVTLRSLMVAAFRVPDYQIEGPDWLAGEHYDIVAKFSEPLPSGRDAAAAAYATMMQKMLVERFKLTTHREQKSFPVYGLVVTKGGIKFKQVPAGPSRSDNNNNHYEGRAVTMPRLAQFLSRRSDLPVLDMTGLKGAYDLMIDWNPEQQRLTDALEDQLGLKLENRKAPLEVVVVDHAERVPLDN